MFVCVFDGA